MKSARVSTLDQSGYEKKVTSPEYKKKAQRQNLRFLYDREKKRCISI